MDIEKKKFRSRKNQLVLVQDLDLEINKSGRSNQPTELSRLTEASIIESRKWIYWFCQVVLLWVDLSIPGPIGPTGFSATIYPTAARTMWARGLRILNDGTAFVERPPFDSDQENSFSAESWLNYVNRVPIGYDSPAAQELLTIAREAKINIVLVVPDSGIELIELASQHLMAFKIVACSLEDLDLADQLGGTNYQFWDAAKLRGYSVETVRRVFDHEYIHNRQAANDPDLAYHVHGSRVDPDQPEIELHLRQLYQSLIEGAAEDEDLGCQVGNASYEKFRVTYRLLRNWAAKNGQTALFDRAIFGDYEAFRDLASIYEQQNSIYSLLSDGGWY